MAVSARRGTVKLWYNFLQMSIRQDVPIDWKAYREWGTRREIDSWSFNKWWKGRGRVLFSGDDGLRPEVQVLESSSNFVTIRLPLEMRIDDIKKSVSGIVLSSRSKKRIGDRGKYAVSGQVNYSTLAQYRRFLEIDFDPRYRGKTIEEKTVALKQVYQKLMAKGLKQRQTLRSRGKKTVAGRFRNRDPEDLDRKRLGGISAKRVSRWRLSAKHLLLNVASGVFPGTGYYGPKLHERLQQRLKAIGLEDIGSIQRARGGRKKQPRRKRYAGLAEHAVLAPTNHR